jgi:hypothetical protein
MNFRSADRAGGEIERREVIVEAAERTFGCPPDTVCGNEVEVRTLVFLYDPESDVNLPFVLRPVCDRCGCTDAQEFPLEEWTVERARVRAQARTTCRRCRFTLLATRDAPPIDLTLPSLFASGDESKPATARP